jgi:hypothetical protein
MHSSGKSLLEGSHGRKAMIRFVAVVFALAVATSAQAAMPVAPLHQPDNMITQVRHACGAGMHMVNGVCRTTVMRRQARRCLVWGAGHVCRNIIAAGPVKARRAAQLAYMMQMSAIGT